MLTKIRTNKKVYAHKSGKMCFVSREIIGFNQQKRKQNFASTIEEIAFLEHELKVLDEEGEETGEVRIVREVIEVINVKDTDNLYSDVEKLFKQLDTSITKTKDFVPQFDSLQLNALLFDTVQPTSEEGEEPVTYIFNTQPSDWIKDEANV